MPKDEASIYGIDNNDMAEGIASDALRNTAGKEEVWGSRTDYRAESYDSDKVPQPGEVEVLAGEKAGAGDDGRMDWDYKKVLPRHRAVPPKESGVYTPPKRFSGKQ